MAKQYATEQQLGPQIGALRIAKVTYDFHPVHASANGQSLGAMIDQHIADTVASGTMVSEVSLFFETQEQQRAVADMYSNVTKANY